MKTKVILKPIQPHPLRDAHMVFAPTEVNPFNVPFIGTLRQCKKAYAHCKKKLIEHGFEVVEA